jgi:hypothetical protein
MFWPVTEGRFCQLPIPYLPAIPSTEILAATIAKGGLIEFISNRDWLMHEIAAPEYGREPLICSHHRPYPLKKRLKPWFSALEPLDTLVIFHRHLDIRYLSTTVIFTPPLANMFTPLIILLFSALTQTVAASTTFEKRCLSFRPETYIDGATRNVLEFVSAGTTLKFPENDATCNRASQAVSADFCRIGLSIKTSAISNVTFEAWLPDNWSGRFLATGNGGIDGCKLTPGLS